METRPSLSGFTAALTGADFVVVDGVVYIAGYRRAPEDAASADDVVLEARHGDTEIDFTRAEMDGAQPLGEGIFRLRSGALLHFLSGTTMH